MVGWETRYYLHHGCHNIRNIIFVWELLQLFIWIDHHIEPSRSPESVLGSQWSHPDQYYRRWRHTASASQSWVCCALLVTGNNSAFSVAGELWPSHRCAVLWLFEGDDRSVSREVADCSLEAALVTALPSMRKNLLDAAKVLTSFPALVGPHSQLVKTSLEVFAGFHRKQLHTVTAPVLDKLIGRS